MSNQSQKSRITAMFQWLYSPSFIGLYITLTFSYLTFSYFNNNEGEGKTGVSTALRALDQLSADVRFHLRGPRPADPSVAILAIDDRSIDIVGRWPWPRDTMGKAIDNAYKYGAKVIAADIVWSEPSDRPEKRLIENIAQKNLIPISLQQSIHQELEKTDPDKTFADIVEKNKSRFILGNFSQDAQSWNDSDLQTGFISVCHDLIFYDHNLKKISERQALPLVVLDKAESILPDEAILGYRDVFDGIEKTVRSSKPEPKTPFEKYSLENEILKEKINFCEKKFLNPQQDDIGMTLRESWPTIKSTYTELGHFSSFDEWARDFKSRHFYNAIPETFYWTLTLPEVGEKAENFGHFNATLDSDGRIRRSQLIARTGSLYMPSIALQAYLVATGYNGLIQIAKDLRAENLKSIESFAISNDEGNPVYTLPVSGEGHLLINYAGPGKTIPHASIADLLDEKNPNVFVKQKVKDEDDEWIEKEFQVSKAQFFKNKILVLGATAIGIYDLRVTPFDKNFPGVETHANVVDNLIRRDFLARPPLEDHYMPLFILALGVILSVSLSYFGALWGLLFSLITVIIIAFVDKVFFYTKGHLISASFPMIQTSFTYVALTFYKYLTEERSKKELRSTFSKYVSPAIVEEILKDPKNLELGGRKENVTVFFSDVRGFTTISEKLDPRALSDFLNSYLTPMTELIFKNQGTLDKYMGDAIMAFFGAPVHYSDHPQMACRCALQSLKKLKELQKFYAKKKLPQIDIGIGLNTGECSVGNMGSETVRSYTVMGDAVNLASRLEGINKTYGTHIIISEFTYREVKNDFVCREVDWVRVKGKYEPVKIYELLTEGKIDTTNHEMLKYFNEGYQHYHQMQFEKAIVAFHKATEKSPADETSKIYVQRCQEYISSPPPSDWDGVYVMTTK